MQRNKSVANELWPWSLSDAQQRRESFGQSRGTAEDHQTLAHTVDSSTRDGGCWAHMIKVNCSPEGMHQTTPSPTYDYGGNMAAGERVQRPASAARPGTAAGRQRTPANATVEYKVC